MTLILAIFLLLLILSLVIREAVLYYRWVAHLRRARAFRLGLTRFR
jgi:hypothetical protein